MLLFFVGWEVILLHKICFVDRGRVILLLVLEFVAEFFISFGYRCFVDAVLCYGSLHGVVLLKMDSYNFVFK